MVAIVLVSASRAGAQTVVTPCPEVLIDQKYDHIGSEVYRRKGWDTVLTCTNHTMELTAEPYIPVQYFNGTYIVEEIPYNPPDPTFARGAQMPISTDDNFANVLTQIPFNFYFFGIKKDQFCLGANGLVSFSSSIHTVYGSANDPGMQCPWQYSAPIPWANTTTGAPTDLDVMRDAIYGVYEDTHPLGSYLTGTQGIYYGIQGEYPCRKIICSWKGIPPYPGSQNLNNRCTYQIVCYEGSNIIEVHVLHRGVNTSWQNGVGIIGIQNATGVPQVHSNEMGAPNAYVSDGKPAAFFPAGKNTFNTELDHVAYRFTPKGTTQKTYYWYRIYDDGRPNDTLTENQNDTIGYYVPMDNSDTLHPTLTKAYVSPTVEARYVLSLTFRNADTTWYRLYDTITIGMDTLQALGIHHIAEPDSSRQRNVCKGKSTTLSLAIPDDQTATAINWRLTRIMNGAEVLLPDDLYRTDASRRNITVHPDPMADTMPENRIDSIVVMATCDFSNGCTNYDTFLLRVHRNYDYTVDTGICIGETFRWDANGQNYTQTTMSPVARLQTNVGCDSIVRLHLTVNDSSTLVDKRVECKPIYWHGKWYKTSNAATMEGDTVRLKNQWGCDSVVRLDLSVYPVTPRIESSIEQFDYDHPEAVLTDVSTGNDSRRWLLPNAPDQTAPVAYYTMPAGMDEATIRLVAFSPYGCSDTATLILPFNSETFWIPNIFTPDDPAGNTLFAPVSTGTLTQEMYIYDRMGRMVYHCEGVDCAWDGRDTHGNPCRQDAYAYVIRYTNQYKPDQSVIRKGSVTLIR